jgi:hypothetical protein
VRSSVHAKTLSDAIYREEEMIKQLSCVSKNIHIADNIKLITHLQVKLCAVSISEIDLEMFKFKKNINELNISVLTEQIQKIASEL